MNCSLTNRFATCVGSVLLVVLCAAAVSAQPGAQRNTSGTVSSASSQTSSAPAPQSTPPAQKLPVIEERVEVTTTRLPEDPQDVPSAVEVFNGDELRIRGYHDLGSALTFAIGVEVAPGGDGGPASSVPGFWGLKELDAFLLVVDGVPWGGSFNPALATLDLNDIERIEVVRGPAPVTYGATSFVCVIHIVHKDTAAKETRLNSSHDQISYAVFCLKKKKEDNRQEAQREHLLDPAADLEAADLRHDLGEQHEVDVALLTILHAVGSALSDAQVAAYR